MSEMSRRRVVLHTHDEGTSLSEFPHLERAPEHSLRRVVWIPAGRSSTLQLSSAVLACLCISWICSRNGISLSVRGNGVWLPGPLRSNLVA